MSRQVLTPQTSASAALDCWVRLLRGSAALRRLLSARLQGDHGLSINDYEALLVLSRAEEGRLRRTDLAASLVLTPSGVTRLLDGLERSGLVAKGTCDSDARVTYAVLTDEGRALLARASRDHTTAVAEVFADRYSPQELETLGELLGRLPEAGAAEDESCSAGSDGSETSR
jgi:DNA-binding MarR family transcriptional regulator